MRAPLRHSIAVAVFFVVAGGLVLAEVAPELSAVGRLVGGRADWISIDGDRVAYGSGQSLHLARGINVPLLEQTLELSAPVAQGVLVRSDLYLTDGVNLSRLKLDRSSNVQEPVELRPELRGRLQLARMVDYLAIAEDGVGIRIVELPAPAAMAKKHAHHGHPTEPRQLRLVPLAESFTALTTSGNTVYAATVGGGLYVVEMSEEPSSRFVSLTAEARALAANGSKLHALLPTGLATLDLSDPGRPVKLGFNAEIRGSALELTGRTMHVGSGSDGLTTFFDRAAMAGATLVTVGDNFFTPQNITINAGDMVSWSKMTLGFHNVASCVSGVSGCSTTANEAFLSGDPTGATFTFDHTFASVGSNDYVCDAHFFAGMVGNVTVEGGRPTPPGTGGLTVSKLNGRGTSLELSFGTSCSAEGHHILYGGGSTLPASLGGTYDLLGAECVIGAGSPYNWNPAPSTALDATGLLWFIVVADDSANNEGAWGKHSGNADRDGTGAAGSSGLCAVTTKDLSNTCGQ